MRIVGLSRDARGQVWATIDGCLPVDVPIEDVPTADILAFAASRRGVASMGALALGGLIEDVQAAGRERLLGWVNDLNHTALRWAQHADRYRVMLVQAGSAMMPGPDLAAIRGAIEHSESKRADAITVRDWLYATLGEVSDVDTFDVTNQRGVVGRLIGGALGALTVPAQVAAIVAGASLAAWVAYQVRQSVDEGRLVDQRAQFVQAAAAAKTPQEAEAAMVGLRQVGNDLQRKDDGISWGTIAAVAAATLAAAYGLKRVLG